MNAEMIEQPNAAPSGQEYENRGLYELPLDQIVADPSQPRKHFDDQAIMELAQSIQKHGILQPVLFRKGEGGQLIVVSGERRIRACKAAGKETIPAIYIESGNSAEIALVENLLRENLSLSRRPRLCRSSRISRITIWCSSLASSEKRGRPFPRFFLLTSF